MGCWFRQCEPEPPRSQGRKIKGLETRLEHLDSTGAEQIHEEEAEREAGALGLLRAEPVRPAMLPAAGGWRAGAGSRWDGEAQPSGPPVRDAETVCVPGCVRLTGFCVGACFVNYSTEDVLTVTPTVGKPAPGL